MANNKFTVSDETLNSYDSVVLTSGINIARFQRNPIMLYMHDRNKGVIGRWENITKEGDKLTAEAVFDDGTELGAKVRHQVESGFLRSASIGIENCKCETINGVQAIVECDLIEISIVDVPANENAVKLFKKGWKPVKTLSELKKNDTAGADDDNTALRTRIIDVLGLSETVTDKDIIEHIKTLLNEPTSVEKEVEEAINNGLISANDRKSFMAMAKGNIKAFRGYCKGRKEAQKAEIERLLDQNQNKVMPMERGTFRHIGERLGAEVLRGVLDSMINPVRLSQAISLPEDKSRWTLEMYRKFAPEELRDNPTLYKRLVEHERGHGAGVKDLDYYRRNEPEYLAAHPDLYAQLIENEQKRK
ncbi:HK97 family phage prohead protease [Duncaniella muricolitica]|jgi:HK97 family phage prohead protease|uniref:HK97 family phage prohead protease n=1 Tax=Duncaniella muricolitica TaxID=2880704 RepID=UPI00244E0746|nr:HK97 family phage prohead protease [Duncaniella muricolitica]